MNKIKLCIILILLGATVHTTAYAAEKNMSRELARANNMLALEFYREVSEGSDNIFFSPLSINSALAMAYAGARGKTAEEMASTLHFPSEQKALHEGYRKFLSDLSALGEKKGITVDIANSLWPQIGHAFLDSYLALVKENYGATVKALDFKTKTEESRKEINDWVETKTNGMIKQLFPKGTIEAMIRLVLVNAVYFKGKWDSPFDKSLSKELPFHLASGETKAVSFMKKSESFFYMESEEVQILELPYIGRTISMILILPKKRDGLSAIEKKLSPAFLEQLFSQARYRQADILIPRFKMSAFYNLIQPLTDLGIKSAFSASADFSGMSEGKEDFFIAEAVHKAAIEVNEEGTEAAAATGFAMATGMPEPPVEFKADHPFFFIIQDKQASSILFLGRLNDPS